MKIYKFVQTAENSKLIETIIVELIENAVADDDLDTLKALESLLLVEDYNQSAPFVPPVGLLSSEALDAKLKKLDAKLKKLDAKLKEIDPKLKKLALKLKKLAPQLEKLANHLKKDEQTLHPLGAARFRKVFMPVANWFAKAERKIQFRRKISSKKFKDIKGNVILSEGDSWFQYPSFSPNWFLTGITDNPKDDVIDYLNAEKDKAILSLGEAGDKLSTMADEEDWTKVPDNLTKHLTPKIFLLSGGGNDLFGDGQFGSILKPYHKKGLDVDDLIDDDMFDLLLNKIEKNYCRVVKRVQKKWRGIHVFGHAYDVPVPWENGPWIGTYLRKKNIPFHIGYKIVEHIFGAFKSKLWALDKDKNNGKGIENFHFVDVEWVVNIKETGEENKDFWKDEKVFEKVAQQLRNNWEDELHPNSDGFKRVADKFRKEIAAVL